MQNHPLNTVTGGNIFNDIGNFFVDAAKTVGSLVGLGHRGAGGWGSLGRILANAGRSLLFGGKKVLGRAWI